MLEFASQFKQVFNYLPVEKEIAKLSRAYLGNVIYTIVGRAFLQLGPNEDQRKTREDQGKEGLNDRLGPGHREDLPGKHLRQRLQRQLQLFDEIIR